jgi:hypothetical protein
MPVEELGAYVVGAGPDEGSQVRSYVEWQAADERVKHLEKVA